MERKQFEIDCPCCASRILVDVRTGQILRTRSPKGEEGDGEAPADWQEALGRVQERTRAGQDRLDQALDREKTRERDLDDLFKKARDKAQRDEEED